jgi:hypothetical protein
MHALRCCHVSSRSWPLPPITHRAIHRLAHVNRLDPLGIAISPCDPASCESAGSHGKLPSRLLRYPPDLDLLCDASVISMPVTKHWQTPSTTPFPGLVRNPRPSLQAPSGMAAARARAEPLWLHTWWLNSTQRPQRQGT